MRFSPILIVTVLRSRRQRSTPPPPRRARRPGRRRRTGELPEPQLTRHQDASQWRRRRPRRPRRGGRAQGERERGQAVGRSQAAASRSPGQREPGQGHDRHGDRQDRGRSGSAAAAAPSTARPARSPGSGRGRRAKATATPANGTSGATTRNTRGRAHRPAPPRAASASTTATASSHGPRSVGVAATSRAVASPTPSRPQQPFGPLRPGASTRSTHLVPDRLEPVRLDKAESALPGTVAQHTGAPRRRRRPGPAPAAGVAEQMASSACQPVMPAPPSGRRGRASSGLDRAGRDTQQLGGLPGGQSIQDSRLHHRPQLRRQARPEPPPTSPYWTASSTCSSADVSTPANSASSRPAAGRGAARRPAGGYRSPRSTRPPRPGGPTARPTARPPRTCPARPRRRGPVGAPPAQPHQQPRRVPRVERRQRSPVPVTGRRKQLGVGALVAVVEHR